MLFTSFILRQITLMFRELECFNTLHFVRHWRFYFVVLLQLFTVKKSLNYLRNQQVGETVRELGLEGQTAKAGTPTMGGINHHFGHFNSGICYC
jgi:triphosphoribosyl-dephospho-CoA synthetase